MPTTGKYAAGKQVSRWDAESDKVDIEYKHLDSQSQPTSQFFSGRKGCLLKVLLLVVCFFVGLILGYLIRRNIHENLIDPKTKQSCLKIKKLQDYDSSLSQLMQNDLQDVANLQDHIDTWTRCRHVAEEKGTQDIMQGAYNMWNTFSHLKSRWFSYTVTLSYPKKHAPNSITLQPSMDDSVLWTASLNQSSEFSPFNAYSASGSVKKKLVFANYGRMEDYVTLFKMNVDVNNTIIILKYGKIHPSNKVNHAEGLGAAGVILYPDPADFANNGSSVYPSTWWLPGWAVHSCHVRYTLMGDPQTPHYPSISGVYRFSALGEECPGCPKIPVQSISYNDARYLLSNLDGSFVPNGWFGGLGIPYKTGPEFKDQSLVNLTVNNVLETKKITNLLLDIEGKYEKNKYVMIGAHIDSWSEGGVDSASGYAVLWELLRTFAYHTYSKDWQPRRSIKFAMWDASKYGHVGSFEWVQEMERELGFGIVAYINLDAVVRGNYTFYAEGSPLLYDIIREAADTVPCSDPDHLDETVLDLWTVKYPDPQNNSLPKIEDLQGDSDHSSFYYYLGVPSFSPAYTYNTKKYKDLPNYPAYNTAEDTKDYLTNFTDRNNYTLHIKVTQIVADVILRLSESAVLPYNIKNLGLLLDIGRKEMKTRLPSHFTDYGSTFLFDQIDKFSQMARSLESGLLKMDKSKASEEQLDGINELLMQLPRLFILQEGIPNYQQYRNMLVSPHPEDLHRTQIFPGIMGAFDLHDETQMNIQQSSLLVAVRQACYNIKSILNIITSVS